jgi:uncharacterized protein YbbK (DUF523 family)
VGRLQEQVGRMKDVVRYMEREREKEKEKAREREMERVRMVVPDLVGGVDVPAVEEEIS